MSKIKAPGSFLCIFFILSTYSAHSQNYKHFYHEASEHFKNACLLNEYSEVRYIKYFKSVGANVEYVNKTKIPFDIYASIEDKGFVSTFFREPSKCCISAINIEPGQFVSWMMKLLPLTDPVKVKVNSKKMLILFKPKYSNRLLTIDADKNQQTNNQTVNLCRTDNSNALKIYLENK
jgi:hypothetical protein